jgi:hypothetical protein
MFPQRQARLAAQGRKACALFEGIGLGFGEDGFAGLGLQQHVGVD